jgi:bifunctional non-homologous end joining protein LigD
MIAKRDEYSHKSTSSPKDHKIPHFVVHKHAGSDLHYDLRLEMGATLKSWALRKGPSLNPKEMRLAIQTGDYPLHYKNFEGIIPKENSDAGEFIIWDKGLYKNASGNTSLLADYKKGCLFLEFYGKKMRGGYILHRLKNKSKPMWLLIKKDDIFVEPNKDITQEDRSVVSGKTLEDIKEAERE